MNTKDLPRLETARTFLRRLSVEDADDMFAYARDPEVARYVSWEAHECIEHTVGYLMQVEEAYCGGGHLDWGIVLKESGRLIGTCGFPALHREHDAAELGYALSREHWGRGLATECARAVLDHGFDRLDLNRIEAFCIPGNAASARVLVKLGMTREGLLRERVLAGGSHRDVHVYSLLLREREEGVRP